MNKSFASDWGASAMWSNASKLRDLLLLTKDGEWGKGEPEQGLTEALVIRGTDFAAVRRDDIESVPIRYIDNTLLERKRLCVGDILIETAGGTKGQPTGRTVIIRKALLQRAQRAVTCASFARFLRADHNKVLPEYLYWWLQEMYRSGQMDQHQVQHTGIARFQYTRFADNVLVPLPPRAAQERIAEILDAMERRIAVLRRMNKTLEAIAEAFFRSWFVDFDPVKSKEEGRKPEGMDAEVAALFPSKRVESELGSIPEGWTIKRLGDILDLKRGYDLPSSQRTLGTIPVVSSSGPSGWHNEAKVLGPGIVTGRYGSIGEVFLVREDFWPLNTTLYVRDLKGNDLMYVYHLLRLLDFDKFSDKAAVPGINRNHLHEERLVTAPLVLQERFSKHTTPMLELVAKNTAQTTTLADLRDTLLPKLLSGEIRVREAEAQVAASA